jgi:large subunit ribosomal protein L20
MNGLRESGVELDRRALAELAIKDPVAFGVLAGQAKEKLGLG